MELAPTTHDILQPLAFKCNAVFLARLKLFDDFKVSVGFDARDEPAVVAINPVEQPEIVETEVEEDECTGYPLTSGHLAVLVG